LHGQRLARASSQALSYLAIPFSVLSGEGRLHRDTGRVGGCEAFPYVPELFDALPISIS
jgi:hypothetical protein